MFPCSSIEKDIVNSATGHTNSCWVASKIVECDLFTGVATILHKGYKSREAFDSGAQHDDVRLVTVNLYEFDGAETLFNEVEAHELETGIFAGGTIIEPYLESIEGNQADG